VLRNNPTDAERLLWSHLRFWQLDGYKFRRQQPLGSYIVDFVCLWRRDWWWKSMVDNIPRQLMQSATIGCEIKALSL
jgi:hypothetical protein